MDIWSLVLFQLDCISISVQRWSSSFYLPYHFLSFHWFVLWGRYDTVKLRRRKTNVKKYGTQFVQGEYTIYIYTIYIYVYIFVVCVCVCSAFSWIRISVMNEQNGLLNFVTFSYSLAHKINFRAVWQPLAFVYIYNVLQVGNSAWNQYLKTTLEFTSTQINLIYIASSVLLYVGVMTYKHYMINWSWRFVYIVCTILSVIFSAMQVLLIKGITFGLPNFAFALGDDAFSEFLAGVQFLPTTIMVCMNSIKIRRMFVTVLSSYYLFYFLVSSATFKLTTIYYTMYGLSLFHLSDGKSLSRGIRGSKLCDVYNDQQFCWSGEQSNFNAIIAHMGCFERYFS